MSQIDADGEEDKQTHALIGAAWEGEASKGGGAISSLQRAVDNRLTGRFALARFTKALLLNFEGPRLDYRRLVFNLRPSVPSAD